jgi:hypothetical protein
MDRVLNQRIERGMTRVRDTPDLGKDGLSEPMQSVYDDIERTLRVPFVNFIFRTLANFPDYFVPAWQALSPHLRQVACERAGDRLRSLAAHEITVEPLAKDILSMEDQSAIVAFTDAIHYVLPKLLLTVTAFDKQASGDFLFSPVPTTGDAALLPYGIAQGTGKLPLLDPADADARLRSLFQDIQDQHGHPGVASYYRGLGQYPVFLGQVWQEVRRHIDTDSYRQRKQSVLTLAESLADRELVRHAPAPMAAAPEAVREILAVFRTRLIPDLLLDVTLIQAMLGDPQAAAYSRFSISD